MFRKTRFGGDISNLELVDKWLLGLSSGGEEVEWGGGMGFARFIVVERNLY